jgi:hypothetical protein
MIDLDSFDISTMRFSTLSRPFQKAASSHQRQAPAQVTRFSLGTYKGLND